MGSARFALIAVVVVVGALAAGEAAAQCSGGSCDCTQGFCTCADKSCVCGNGPACDLVSRGPASLECNAAPCNIVAGANASITCRGGGSCTGTVGANSTIDCQGDGFCTFTVGPGTRVIQTGRGPADITCQSTCFLQCGDVACNVNCAGSASELACGDKAFSCGSCDLPDPGDGSPETVPDAAGYRVGCSCAGAPSNLLAGAVLLVASFFHRRSRRK
jgi:MYXO-CTERM domain-containing protein